MMTIEELKKDKIKAMKEKNEIKKLAINAIITQALNLAIAEGKKDNITEDIVDTAILKIQRIYLDQVNTCPKDRPELLAKYKEGLEYVNFYAPKMMSKEEIKDIVMAKLPEIQVLNVGSIMKKVMPIIGKRANGNDVKEVAMEVINEITN